MAKPNGTRLPLSLLALSAVLEGKYKYRIVDGNIDGDAVGTVLAELKQDSRALVAITVMPGPQIAPAIAISSAVRAQFPGVPIAWGGYFPTLYSGSAINAPYVDYVIRGQGEDTLTELLDRLPDAGTGKPTRSGLPDSAANATAVAEIHGITWRRGGEIIHNTDRKFRPPDNYPPYPYERLENAHTYFRPSFLGNRTAVHQVAIGCRYRCTFCGVVSMFGGYTRLSGVERLHNQLTILRNRYHADAIQFYDHNFFDREETSTEVVDVLTKFQMPWWCYARADTLANFSTQTWERIRRSRLRMAYIGAEASSDAVLKSMKKGTKVEHTFEAARRCREYGVIPEFSFVLGGPADPEENIERTFEFIKQLKRIHAECEIILYFYSPTPQTSPTAIRNANLPSTRPTLERYGPNGPPLPTTPEAWTEPRWIDYVCHRDAPWLTSKLRRRVRDFSKVLQCRFPTVQDHNTPKWEKRILSTLASWRYATGYYRDSWELDIAKRLIRLREPERESI